MQAGCIVYVGLSVLPATNQLLYSPLSLCSSLSVPIDLPEGEGGFPGCWTLSSFTVPSQGCRLHPASFSPPPPIILPSYVEIFPVPSGV